MWVNSSTGTQICITTSVIIVLQQKAQLLPSSLSSCVCFVCVFVCGISVVLPCKSISPKEFHALCSI